MLPSFSDFASYGLNESYTEEQQQYIDIIAMDPVRNAKYKANLKELGVDFDSIFLDLEHIQNANLRDIKKKTDFLDYGNYIEYARKIFAIRNLNLPSHIDKTLGFAEVVEVGERLGFKVELRNYTGYGNYASHSFGHISVPNPVDVNTLIHEMGHQFDYATNYMGFAKTITHASSPYAIYKNSEVFAENFMHYFIAPEWLKSNLPEVFRELDGKITREYKTVIRGMVL